MADTKSTKDKKVNTTVDNRSATHASLKVQEQVSKTSGSSQRSSSASEQKFNSRVDSKVDSKKRAKIRKVVKEMVGNNPNKVVTPEGYIKYR